MQTWLG